MNTQAYISLALRIAALVPDVKYIDLFNQQYIPNEERKYEAFSKPAVFIEYGQTNWNYTMNNMQQGTGTVKLHVVTERYKATANIQTKTAPEQQNLLAFLKITPKVHAAVQGYVQAGTAGSMQRTSTTPDNNHDNLVIEVLDYTFIDEDDSADEYADWVPVTITEIDIVRNLVTLNNGVQIGSLLTEGGVTITTEGGTTVVAT